MPLTKSRSTHAPLRSISLRRAALVALLAASACGKKEEPKAPPPRNVQVAQVVQRDVPIGSELTGTIKGFEDVEIRARVEGYLKTIDYREGSEVKKGQLLFTIDDSQYRTKVASARGALARAQAAYGKADTDVKRFRPLVEQRAISQAELDNALSAQRSAAAQVDAARADAEKAELDLSYCRVTSPITGLAGKAERKPGDLVGKGEPTLLTTVSTLDPVRVSVQLPEALYLRYADRFAAAEAAAARGEARPPPAGGEGTGPELVLGDGSVHAARGQVVMVDRSVDATTGTLRVDLAYANPKRTLRPGMYGKVRYKSEVNAGAILVPQRAVQELQGQYTVVAVDAEKKAATRKVKPGARVGSLWLIEEGLKAGEQVIVEGAQKARDGMVVNPTVVPAEPPAAAPAPAGAPAEGAAKPPEGAPVTPAKQEK
jgi:membrane fusion protein (multidrug efflux system)